MRSFVWTICVLCALGTCDSADVVKKKYPYGRDDKLDMDDQSISDNSLVYSACRVDKMLTEMSCSISLLAFPEAKSVREFTCQINRKASKAHRISEDKFRVRKLLGRYVAFAWAEQEHLQSGDVPPRKRLLLSVIDMENCRSSEYQFAASSSIDDFHIVVYERTFDVYYHNRSMSGHFMSGMTFDSEGELINGPAISYLPSDYFKGNSRMCSVQSNSSEAGHYVITPNDFNLVSAEFGKKIQMGAIPFDNRNAVYDCSADSLGYCWQISNNRLILNCQQFNSKGKSVLSTGESLKFEPGTWLAMKNVGPAELLILINECKDAAACAADTERVKFHVMKVNYSGKAVDLYQFEGLECNNATTVNGEVRKRDDGRICATIACKTRADDGNQSISFLSTCFLQ